MFIHPALYIHVLQFRPACPKVRTRSVAGVDPLGTLLVRIVEEENIGKTFLCSQSVLVSNRTINIHVV